MELKHDLATIKLPTTYMLSISAMNKDTVPNNYHDLGGGGGRGIIEAGREKFQGHPL
jgi:hypothetical protein